MKSAAERADEDVLLVTKTPAGRRLLWRLLVQSGLFSGSFVDSPTGTAFNEGRRSVGVALLREWQRVAPDEYALAFQEAFSEAQAAAQAPAAGE